MVVMPKMTRADPMQSAPDDRGLDGRTDGKPQSYLPPPLAPAGTPPGPRNRSMNRT
jgi:hypothetical protein